ncbi:MAG: HigA family addiction module antidote protein [Solirubrobacteraceae bacterium]|nr:HigA family addiction module antidote protein [Solirubrobacteraceae bacterium]
MTQDATTLLPDWASPPGDTLADLLDERDMTQTELAERLGVTLKHVNRVIKGAATISADLALGLEKVFGASAAFWMTREAHYQAALARHGQRQSFAEAVGWAKQFPINELRKREILPREAEGPELVEQLLSFLGIAHPEQWKEPQVAYRKSQKFDSDQFALATWLREGERQAAELECEPYDEDRFVEVLQEARSLTRLAPEAWWPELQSRCARAGVAVVLVDVYKGAKANGATRWLAPDKALIQLSLRYGWEDIFWFSFFHEAGHVVLHRKKDVFVEVAGKDRSTDPHEQQLEAEADRFAARALIPPPHDKRLVSLNLQDVEAFAQMLDIAPAIVVGRMHHEEILPWNQGNGYRRRLKFVG